MLPNGAFVVSNSRREFAMLTFIDKGNLNNIPIDADLRQVWLKVRRAIRSLNAFRSTALVHLGSEMDFGKVHSAQRKSPRLSVHPGKSLTHILAIPMPICGLFYLSNRVHRVWERVTLFDF